MQYGFDVDRDAEMVVTIDGKPARYQGETFNLERLLTLVCQTAMGTVDAVLFQDGGEWRFDHERGWSRSLRSEVRWKCHQYGTSRKVARMEGALARGAGTRSMTLRARPTIVSAGGYSSRPARRLPCDSLARTRRISIYQPSRESKGNHGYQPYQFGLC
jgi:hypothetical protein